jgi:uncharacterized protein YjiS (DUF1127 family)
MSRLVKIEHLPALPWLGLLARAFEHAAATLRQWGRRIRSRRHLQTAYELDDRLLRDIGLRRADLLCEIAKPFWR